jgi:hypothetical protein
MNAGDGLASSEVRPVDGGVVTQCYHRLLLPDGEGLRAREFRSARGRHSVAKKEKLMSTTQVQSPQSELFYLPPDISSDGVQLAVPGAESRIGSLIREFEADVEYAQQHLSKDVDRNAGYLIPQAEQSALPPRARAILDRYAVVDTLAIFYRDRTSATFFRLLAITLIATLVLELFAHILAEFFFPVGARWRLIIWIFYPGVWLGAYCVWYHAHHRQFQKKYHDYRALAEGLRVQLFWNLLGLPDPIEEYYLRKQKGELEWIRRAVRFWRERDETAIPDPGMTAERQTNQKNLVIRRWVRAQLQYFAEVAGPREKRRSDLCKWWAKVLFWANFVLAIILGCCEVWHRRHAPLHTEWGFPPEESVLIFAISMLLAGAALAVAYGEKMAFLEHARQYGATSILFRETDERLTAGNLNPAEEADEFRRLGKEALQENGDWLLLHRDRPLEVILP